MPACINCHQLENCKTLDWSLGRASKVAKKQCELAIFQKHLPNMHGEILEIGHGTMKIYRKWIARAGLTWKGIDPKWPDGNHGHYQGTAANIPFPDESQDWLFAFSVLEHVWEHGEALYECLKEFRRVLKPGGKLLIAVPIHLHGDDLFYAFYPDLIAKSFLFWDWKTIKWEDWRLKHEPLPAMPAWKEQRVLRAHKESVVKRLEEMNPSTWTLEIYCEKP